MTPYLDSIWFVAVVFGLALIAWFVRSFIESKPDSLLLNFTFFAFAGQSVFTAEMLTQGISIAVPLILLLIGLILLLFQVLILRAQAQKTVERYQRILEQNKVSNLSSAEIEHWATMLLRVTGVDFYPEFYVPISTGSSRGPREKQRKEAISILPQASFKSGSDGVTADSLLVPAEERTGLWRSYVLTCLAAWLNFIICISVAFRS